MNTEEFQKYLMELEEKRKVTAKSIIEKRELECPLYRPGDIITIGGVAIAGTAMPVMTVVIKEVRPPYISEIQGSASYFYTVKPIRDGRPSSGSFAVGDSDIREGKCRPVDIPRWEGPLTKVYESEFAPPKILITTPPSTAAGAVKPTAERDDFVMFREIVDGLLGSLPQKKIEEFVETPEYKVYSEVMEDGKSEVVQKKFVDIVDSLLGDLPQKTVEEFVATPDFKVYERVIKKYKKE